MGQKVEKGEIDPSIVPKLEKWLEKGNRIAVYRNVDLSHPEVGRLAFMEVGKTATYKEAPERMPDNPVIPIAWRYRLQQVIGSKKKLEEVV